MKRIFCLVMVMMLLLCSCGDGSSSGKESNSPQQSASTISEPEKNQNSVGLDGTISGDCFDISIVSAKWVDELEMPLGPVSSQKKGNKLLFLVFSAKNTTDETENLGSFNAYVDKQATLPTVAVGEIDGAMPFVGAVASGMGMKAYQVWELPEDWEEFQINYFEATGPECKQYFVINREDIG